MKLGVNIDHIATLREVRKARYPSVIDAMFCCERGGADQITVHLREDRRHIQEADVVDLLQHSRLPLNLEMALVPDLFRKAARWKPYSVTLVPERRAEMTTESGLNLLKAKAKISQIRKLQKNTRIVAFIDPDLEQVTLAKALNLDGVEFHTGPYAHAFELAQRGRAEQKFRKEEVRLKYAAERAAALGLEVKAGHGLTVENVEPLVKISEITELNIGHSIVARAVIVGLEVAVHEMKSKLHRDAVSVVPN